MLLPIFIFLDKEILDALPGPEVLEGIFGIFFLAFLIIGLLFAWLSYEMMCHYPYHDKWIAEGWYKPGIQCEVYKFLTDWAR